MTNTFVFQIKYPLFIKCPKLSKAKSDEEIFHYVMVSARIELILF